MIATTGAHLLEAIKADPADDLPRLAYADWLEETGEDLERAELIRVQILLANWRCLCRNADGTWNGACWCGSNDLRRRETQLRSAIYQFGAYAEFRRGFVHTVRCPLATWLEHGPAIVRLHPVERVEATDRQPVSPGGTARPDANYWSWSNLNIHVGAADIFNSTPDTLPVGVFERLQEFVTKPRSILSPSLYRHYRTERAARDALSAALIALATR